MGQGRKEELKMAFLFLTRVTRWVLLMEIWEKVSVMAKLSPLLEELGGNDKKIVHLRYPEV